MPSPNRPETNSGAADVVDQVWLTVKAVARRLDVSEDMIYKLIRSGQLAAIRIGTEYRISEEDYADYISRARVPRSPS